VNPFPKPLHHILDTGDSEDSMDKRDIVTAVGEAVRIVRNTQLLVAATEPLIVWRKLERVADYLAKQRDALGAEVYGEALA
jgi:hypothetical protein